MGSLGLALAGGIGLILGLLGGGGSILTVPVFVYVLDFDPKQAVAMSLPVVGLTSLAGVLGHWRGGHVHGRRGLLFGGVAMAGAYGGARLGVLLPGAVQLLVLAAVMLGAAGLMLRREPSEAGDASPLRKRGAFGLAGLAAMALGVGLITGVVGIGGGFLVVPVLMLAGMPMTDAVGTSLLVIVLNALAGFAGYVGRVFIPWEMVALFSLAATVGVMAGVYLMRFVPQKGLQQAFGALLVLVAGMMLVENLTAMRAPDPAAAAVVGSQHR